MSVITVVLTAKVAAFLVRAYVTADVALYAFSTRPFFQIIFTLAVATNCVASPHILFAVRAAI
jgi:hypothetical protein